MGRRRTRDDAHDAGLLDLIIAELVIGLRWLLGQGRPGARDEALEILRQRYARGEIDKQEFDARRRDLGH